ncbi:hypothetical protein SAMN02745171_01577 [Porphyromonas circumdentaria]|uniref:Lipoprotein n=1 Tax=Porphyromonas circumdentaria TaxID=29524 RepID=A0A1T4PT44_9PORP|nr:hypothetical protein [Porphyromonas circumdentaria]SJZ94703.1 hypothetical protein SAMN02745171_01577 [Porphyromonas circumdentaria]
MIKILKEPLYREKFAYWSFCFLFFCSCAKDREQKLPHIFWTLPFAFNELPNTSRQRYVGIKKGTPCNEEFPLLVTIVFFSKNE